MGLSKAIPRCSIVTGSVNTDNVTALLDDVIMIDYSFVRDEEKRVTWLEEKGVASGYIKNYNII